MFQNCHRLAHCWKLARLPYLKISHEVIFSCPKGSSIDDEVTGGAGGGAGGTGAAVLRKSSLEASQGQETAREDQGRSGEAQGSERPSETCLTFPPFFEMLPMCN